MTQCKKKGKQGKKTKLAD